MKSSTMYYRMITSLVIMILGLVGAQVDGACRRLERNTGCPYPWLAWRDHCYLSVSGLKLKFDQAENNCQGRSNSARPAHLASVTSEEENQFLNAHRIASGIQGCWIGYKDDGGSFSWTDGSANTGFLNWADGQPDTGNRNGWNCAVMYGEPWSLQWCTNANYFVCKMARIA